jgi:hypothetical protein
MGIFDSIFGGYSADRKAKEEFTLKIKDAGKAYIIDSGTYISGPFIVDKPIKGTLYINKRGLFFQAIPATKCIVIYVEDILKIEAFKEKKKCIKVDYKIKEKPETLIMEAFDAEGCMRELKKAIEEYRPEDRENLPLKKK